MNIRNFLRDNTGMTLVEGMVAIVIVAVAALMMVMGFGLAGTLINRGTDLKESSDSLFSDIESPSAADMVTETPINVSFSGPTGNFMVNGRMIMTIDDDHDDMTTYYAFVPDK